MQRAAATDSRECSDYAELCPTCERLLGKNIHEAPPRAPVFIRDMESYLEAKEKAARV